MREVGSRLNVVFLDFEASSLDHKSSPIEVGWCDAAGHGQAHLIRLPEWASWDNNSEKVHGITREMLAAEGKPVDVVARRAHAVLEPSKAVVFSDAPDYDQHWLDVLMASAECWPIPRLLGVTRLLSTECEVMREANREVPETPAWHHENSRISNRVRNIIGSVQERHESPRVHRAQPDAERLWRMWVDVRAVVAKELSRRTDSITGDTGPVDDGGQVRGE
jgi:hypothetical protein